MKTIINAQNTNQRMMLDIAYDTMYKLIDALGGLWKVEDGDNTEWVFPGGYVQDGVNGGWCIPNYR